jgi:hypothetical protein
MADGSKPQPLDYRGPTPKRVKVPEDPESRRWRYRRMLFRIGLFVLLAPVALYFGPNLIMFGKLTRRSPADFVPVVQRECAPTVRAMKEYRRDTGHLPQDIQDLVPKYLASVPWGQEIDQSGGFLQITRQESHYITYDFTPGREAWTVHGYFANGAIPLPPVVIGQATQPVLPPK